MIVSVLTFIWTSVAMAAVQELEEVPVPPPMVGCCEAMDSGIPDFMRCVNGSVSANERAVLQRLFSDPHPGPTLSVGLVTFASSNIWDYSAFSLAVNGAYAERNGYIMRHVDPSMSNPEPTDARWSKVALLSEALDPHGGWGRDLDYVVWFDADLVVLDLDLRMEAVAAAHPRAHVLVSAEHAGSSTMINSGAILVRNSAWARNFLRDWWNYADRCLYSDQEQFDLLYQRLSKADRARIVVLAPDALNSDPPAMTTLQPHNRVLHLMGDHTPFRQAVFRGAFEAICDAARVGGSESVSVGHDGQRGRGGGERPWGPLPPQLGVSRAFLLELTLDTYSAEVEDSFNHFESQAAQGEGSLSEARRLANAVHHVAHALEVKEQSGQAPPTAVALRARTFAALLSNIENMRASNAAHEQTHGRAMTDWPELLKNCCEAGQNLVHSQELPLAIRGEYASSVLGLLDEILDKCHRLQRPAVLQMRASMFGELGHLARQAGRTDDALGHYERYLDLAQAVGSTVGDHITLEPLSLVATMLASLGRVHEASPMYAAAIELSVRTVGPGHRSTAMHLINAGIAKNQGGHYSEAVSLLQDGLAVLDQNNVDGHDDVYRKAESQLHVARGLLTSINA
jgi:tetratricopeptide (TPR) repeat protein